MLRRIETQQWRTLLDNNSLFEKWLQQDSLDEDTYHLAGTNTDARESRIFPYELVRPPITTNSILLPHAIEKPLLASLYSWLLQANSAI
jgi:hypothetical protein